MSLSILIIYQPLTVEMVVRCVFEVFVICVFMKFLQIRRLWMGLLPSDVCSMSCDDKVSVCPSHTHLFVDIICFTILTIHAHYYITEMARHCLVTNVPTPAVVVSRPGGCPSVSQREEFSPPLCKVSGNICDILRSWWDTFSHLPRLAEETKTILFPEVNESCWASGAVTASCRLDRSGKLLDLQRNCLLQLGWIGNMAKNKSAKEINSDKQVRQIN